MPPARHNPVRAWAAAVLTTFLLAACGSSATTAPSASVRQPTPEASTSASAATPDVESVVARITAGFSPDGIAATETLLRAVGARVVADGSDGAASPTPSQGATLVLQRASVELMASNEAAGIGFTDRVLDDLTGSATADAVAAWATGAGDLAQQAAQALTAVASASSGDRITTPLVLALYLADAERATAAVGPGRAADVEALGRGPGSVGLLALASLCDPYIAGLAGALGSSPAPTGPEMAAIQLLLDLLPIIENGQDRWFELTPPTNAWTVTGGPGRTGTVTLHATSLVDSEISAYIPCIDPFPPSGAVRWTFIGAGNAIVTSEDDMLVTEPVDAQATLTYAMSHEVDGATQPATSQMAVLAGYEQLALSQVVAAIQPLLGGAPTSATALLAAMFGRLQVDVAAGPLLGMRPALIPVTYHVCGGSDPCASGAPKPSPSPTIAGVWHGSWASETYAGLAGGFTLTFVANGTKLTGTIAISGSACIGPADITGTLNGSKIQFGAVEGAETIAYEGTWAGSTLGGTWQVTNPSGGQCTNDYGTWQATR